MIEIIEYKHEHQPFFERFNRMWIEQYFDLEEIDKYVLFHPEEAIIKPGGAILMALFNELPVGTVALKKNETGVYEFTKMAVDPQFRRKGIGMTLSIAAIKKAEQLGAEKIILYSQTILKGAIELYRKLGFYEVNLEPGTYKRANIKMELPLNIEKTNNQKLKQANA